jgi:hypothetical protein
VPIAWLRLTTTTGHHPKGDATRAACSVARASSVRWMVEARCITTKRGGLHGPSDGDAQPSSHSLAITRAA